MIDFSIITPSYNYGHFLEECLASVAAQEGVALEHLVMDGGSSDQSADVVAKYPHAQFFQEPDRGMSDAINKGFRRAQGNWVMWLNADDRLKPGVLKELKEFLTTVQADVVYGGWDYIDKAGAKLRSMTLFPFQKYMLIQYGCYIGSTACFFRRESVMAEGFLLNEDFHYCMDGEYYARLACAGKKFVHMPRFMADFRLHDESISQSNLHAADLGGILKMQKQIAEVYAIRRAYGWNLGKRREIINLADALSECYFWGLRVLLKLVYKSSYQIKSS